MTRRIRGLLPALILVATAGLAITACGDDSGTAATETAAAGEPVDAAAFKGCMLGSSLDRGVYEEVPAPAEIVQQAAADTGADFFEAGKADDGLAFFFIYDEPTSADEAAGTVEEAVTTLAGELTKQAPKGIELGSAFVSTEGSLVVGLVPFSETKSVELQKETFADVSSCLAEI